MEYSIRINKSLYRTVPLLLRMFGHNFIQDSIHRPGGFPFWQLLIGVSGTGECRIGESRHILRPGEILLLPPDFSHSYHSTSSDDWIVHFLGFTGSSCQKLLVDMRFSKPGIYHLKNQETCSRHIEEIAQILENGPADKSRILSKELYSFLLDISHDSSFVEMSEEVQKNQLVSDILLYLEEHYAEDISLRELAEHTGKTPEYLCSCFRKETGETIMYHLATIRVGRARQMLLENPDLPVYKVGEQCGFRSPSYFGKVFRVHTGVSPQKLAQKHS